MGIDPLQDASNTGQRAERGHSQGLHNNPKRVETKDKKAGLTRLRKHKKGT